MVRVLNLSRDAGRIEVRGECVKKGSKKGKKGKQGKKSFFCLFALIAPFCFLFFIKESVG
jgi:hypothetical protein